MGDQNADDAKKDIIEGEDTTKTSDEKKESGDSKSDADADKKSDDSSKEDKKDDKEDDDINLDEEPKTRKSKVDYIIARKTAKQQKLADKEKKGGGEGDDKEENEEDENEGDEKDEVIDPKDKDLIGQEVQKHLQPILEREEMNEIKSEVSTFITTNPDFKPFEAKIIKFASHPSRKQLPISSIAYEVAGPALLKMGAKRGKEADAEAKANESGGGGSKGGDGGGKGIWDMTVDEFKEKQKEVLSRQNKN